MQGDILGSKPDGFWRFWFDDYDWNLVIPRNRYKATRMRNIISNMGVDVVGGAELLNNCTMIGLDQGLEELFKIQKRRQISIWIQLQKEVNGPPTWRNMHGIFQKYFQLCPAPEIYPNGLI